MPRRRKDLSGSDEENDSGGRRYTKNIHPLQRNAANERERSRMRVLSKAFSKLKTTLPMVPSDTKLSKLDTLRLASSYIAHLKQVLDSEDEEITCNGNQSTINPINLTWPFSFHVKSDDNGSVCKSDRDSSSSSSSMEQHLEDLVNS